MGVRYFQPDPWRREFTYHVSAAVSALRIFTIEDSIGWALYESLPVERDLA